MNRISVVLLSLVLSAVAQAQTTTPDPAAAVPADSKEPVVVQAPVVAKADIASHCIKETGSRIVHKNKTACLNEAGRSYDQDDLRRTGANTVGDALRLLDPAISIHR